MKMYKVKLRCSCEIRGKRFRAGEVITVKRDKYAELASQGFITEVVEEIETDNMAKRLEQPPNDKMLKTDSTENKMDRTKTRLIKMRKTAGTKRKRRRTKKRTTKK